MLTLNDLLTSSGKYPWRAQHKEVTDEVRENGLDLVTRVNYFFKDVGYPKTLRASSGFRPSEVNAKTKGASKKSGHMRGESIDLEDPARELALICLSNLKLLEKHGLWMEDPKYTHGWVHLQKYAPKSGKQVFIP